ncbi:MAG: hypothetical protein DI640_12970 [Sphingomonas taxi]|uniref:Uncharacterized protein n=1 Tax=Sphingomonas taxi TaxID=1549858 RepID=A0A2W4YQG6_9SPHN|nr:MAG: hypothetical protein DI640_12970 [Sphingomonas taxi]
MTGMSLLALAVNLGVLAFALHRVRPALIRVENANKELALKELAEAIERRKADVDIMHAAAAELTAATARANDEARRARKDAIGLVSSLQAERYAIETSRAESIAILRYVIADAVMYREPTTPLDVEKWLAWADPNNKIKAAPPAFIGRELKPVPDRYA